MANKSFKILVIINAFLLILLTLIGCSSETTISDENNLNQNQNDNKDSSSAVQNIEVKDITLVENHRIHPNEVSDTQSIKLSNEKLANPPPSPAPAVVEKPKEEPKEVTASSGGCGPGQVDINSASETELQQIKHIGPERAKQIINLRPFSSVDSLSRIKGIGAR